MNQPAYVLKPVQLRLKPELHQWVHAEARSQERSANWLINKLLAEAYAKATAGQTPN